MSWIPLDFIADALNGDGNIDFDVDFDKFDLNSDGVLSCEDCPFIPGSTEAKLWWRNVMEPYVHSRLEPSWTEHYGDSVVGGYKGKPLVPGIKGSSEYPQGDFDFLKDKIKITQGLSEVSARKIAAKVMWNKF